MPTSTNESLPCVRKAVVEVATLCQTRVKLHCPLCHAQVAPCDVCDALMEFPDVSGRDDGDERMSESLPTRRPATCCKRCGALRVDRDHIRAEMSLKPIESFDPIDAVSLSMEMSSCAATLERKRVELIRLQREKATENGSQLKRVNTGVHGANGVSSTPTDDENDTPNDQDSRRILTFSSVQCGQRLVPDSMFKTPRPSRLGRTTPVRSSEASNARHDILDAAISRVKYQIMFCERAASTRKRPRREFGPLELEILDVALRRAGCDSKMRQKILSVSIAFVREKTVLTENVRNAKTLRTALKVLDMDIHKGGMLRRVSPDQLANESEEGLFLLNNTLKYYSAQSTYKVKTQNNAHVCHLRDITRVQNEMFDVMIREGGEKKRAAQVVIRSLLNLYSYMYSLAPAALV